MSYFSLFYLKLFLHRNNPREFTKTCSKLSASCLDVCNVLICTSKLHQAIRGTIPFQPANHMSQMAATH